MKFQVRKKKQTCVQISLKKNHMFFEQPFNSISRSHYSNCIKIIQSKQKDGEQKSVLDTPNNLYNEKFIQPWASGGARGSCLPAETSLL